MRQFPLPIPSAQGWQKGLPELARWSRHSMTVHPTVGQLLLRYNVWPPSALAVGERWMALWLQSGLDVDSSIQAAMMSSISILGLVHEEMRLADFVSPSDHELTSYRTCAPCARPSSIPTPPSTCWSPP